MEDGEWLKQVRYKGKTYWSKTYSVWQGIRNRTKVGAYQTRHPAYSGATICKDWYDDFQVFAEWYVSQTGYALGWDIEKDYSGTSHYSPETCILVPHVVNIHLQEYRGGLGISSRARKDSSVVWGSFGKEFQRKEDAEANSRHIKTSRIEDLRRTYVPQGVPDFIFDKALSLIK